MRGHSGGYAADLLVAALEARPSIDTPLDPLASLGDDINISREYPRDPKDFAAADGTLDAIWVGRNARQDVDDIDVNWSFGSGPPHITDETYRLWVTVLCLRNDTDGTQKVATDRASVLLGELLGAVAADPTLGFVDAPDLSTFWCRGVTSMLRTGALDAGHGAGFEVGLRFQCRLHLS